MSSHRTLAVLVLCVASVEAGCSSVIGRPIGDGSADADADEDVDADVDADSDADDEVDGVADADGPGDADVDDAGAVSDADEEASAPSSICGDGVRDGDEACDDHNRLNGDGCDWLCRLGDGEPTPEPDPSVSEYVASGDPTPADDVVEVIRTQTRPPLTWSGTQYATAYQSVEEGSLRFHRFGPDGETLDTDWDAPASAMRTSASDLVWTGTEYGLFWFIEGAGIYFLRLDVRGKPLSSPLLIVPHAWLLTFAADRTADGYVLAVAACTTLGGQAGLALLDGDGSTEGLPPPLVTEIEGCEQVDVATGADGFGVSLEPSRGAAQFLRVSADLSGAVTSGILGEGHPGDVIWDGAGYVMILAQGEAGSARAGSCTARFSPAGVLEAAPVCRMWLETGHLIGGARVAAGDGGLALVYVSNPQLYFQRADSLGIPVGASIEIDPDADPGPWGTVDGSAIVWADDGFGVLYSHGGGTMMLQRFGEARP